MSENIQLRKSYLRLVQVSCGCQHFYLSTVILDNIILFQINVTRCLIKVAQFFKQLPKEWPPQQFYIKRVTFSKLLQKESNIQATFVTNFVSMVFQKQPDLVALLKVTLFLPLRQARTFNEIDSEGMFRCLAAA